jgi:hypothetical protein
MLMENLDLFESIASSIAKTQGKEVTVFTGARKEKVNNGFVLLFYEAVTELIFNKAIALSEIKVLLAFCKIAEFGNLISVNQKVVAKLIGMDEGNFSKSVARLIESGVLIKSELGLFFNPNFVVKGKLDKVADDLWAEAFDKTGKPSALKKVANKQAINEKLKKKSEEF